jgi:hypothetical protein
MEKTILDGFIMVIQQVGFPIVVAGWLLWRTDKRLETLSTVLTEIAKSLATINAHLEDDTK